MRKDQRADVIDLRVKLAEAIDGDDADDPAGREEPESGTEAPETPETPSGERRRGPDGNFQPREAAQSEGGEQEPGETGEGRESEEQSERTSTEAPKHWSAADKETLAALPKEARAPFIEFYKRIEAGFQPKLRRAAELEKQFSGAAEVFAPYADALRQRNQTPSDVVRAWASVERGFIEGFQDAQQGRQNEKGALLIANLIRSYQVDPGDVAAILQGQRPAPQSNGASAVPPEVLQEINSLKQWRQQNERATAVERLTSAERQIATFAAEKDGRGNLAHPFFSELESQMMELAKFDRGQGKTPDLADLYERALYSNRDTREKVLAGNESAAKQKALVERKAKAAAAQRASSSVTGSPGSGLPPSEERKGHRSVREDLEAAAADLEDA
jgi:hypothetical protein